MNHAFSKLLHMQLTVEDFCFLQEPLQPAQLTELLQLRERAPFIDFGIMGELGAFNQREDDGIFEPDQYGADAV